MDWTSGSPFRPFSLSEVPEDKLHLVHEAFLLKDYIRWTISNEQELQFISNVIKEHKQIDMLSLLVYAALDFSQLIAAILSGRIVGISLQRIRVDINQLLIALQQAIGLKKLEIYDGPLPSEYDALACAIQNEHLEIFSFYSDQFPSEAWISLAPVLAAHKSLRKLKFPRSCGRGMHAMGEILATNSSIQRLELADKIDNIQPSDLSKLCEGLKSNSTLESLSLSLLPEGATIVVFESLALNQCKVSHLKLSADVTEQSLTVLGESLKANTTLTHLDLLGCGITDDKCHLLCKILTRNNTVKQLGIKHDAFGIQVLKSICDSLVHNDNLEVLDLTWCEIDDVQCKLIAQMLLKNKSLTALILSSNNFTNEGINEIYAALVRNTTLKKLKVGGNKFSVNGLAGGVKTMLTQNNTLRYLQLTVDTKSEKSLALLCDGLRSNTSLTALEINPFIYRDFEYETDIGMKKLKEILKDNYAIDTIKIIPVTNDVEPFLQRNRALKSEIKYKVAILCHNIARSDHALAILPREMWVQILSAITHPGMNEFKLLVRHIFDSYL